MLRKSEKTVRKARKDPNRYPPGWSRQKVERVIAHYENQSDEEAMAEDEAAYHDQTITMMAVPIELVAAVQRLIAKRAG